MGFFIASLINFFISTAVALILKPKPQKREADNAKLSDLKFPVATEGKSIPLVIGRRHITSPNLIFFRPTHKHVTDEVYTQYYASMHMVVAYAPVILFEILVSGKLLGITETESTIRSGQASIALTNLPQGAGFTEKTLTLPLKSKDREVVTVDRNGLIAYGSSFNFGNSPYVDYTGALITYIDPLGNETTETLLSLADVKERDTGQGDVNDIIRTGGNNKLFIGEINGKIYAGMWGDLFTVGTYTDNNDGEVYNVTVVNGIPDGKLHSFSSAALTPDAVNSLFSGVIENTNFKISKPNLLGGLKERGGIQGDVQFLDGFTTFTTAIENNIKSETVRADTPHYLGVSSVFVSQCYVGANSPSIPPWSFDVGSYPNSLGVPNSEAVIEEGANPACFLYECLVNKIWGASLEASKIDVDSFTAAATILKKEKLGSHFVWSGTEKISSIMNNVLGDIFGYWIRDDINLSKLKLVLMRPFDGDINTLEVLKPLNKPRSKGVPAYGDVNQVVATYKEHSFDEDRDRTLTVNHSAAISVSDSILKTMQVTLPTLGTEASALYIAKLHLLVGSSPLQTYELTIDIYENVVSSGDFVIFNHDASNTQLHRVLNVDITGRKAKLKIVEDVFSTSFYGAEFAGFDPNELYAIP